MPLVSRPRLAEVMARRWNRRVTALVAGAGFGKSALVVQALAANHDHPLGVDAWIGCQDEDVRLDRFFEALFVAVRGEPPLDGPVDVDDAVHRLADAVWSHAPMPITVMIDDVHLLGRDTAGAELLDQLVRRLPANAHFVVTSRTLLPFSLAGLLARGEAVVLGEDDLVMTEHELRELAARRDVPDLDLSGTGGWPALAALAVHTGSITSRDGEDYLAAELLDTLPETQVRALAVLAGVGPLRGADLVTVVGDAEIDVDELVRLPMVDTAMGLIEVHALWNVTVGRVDPGWLTAATVAAARVLRDGGDLERAFALAVAASDDELCLDVLGELCRTSIHTAAEVDLPGCLAMLPAHLHGTPAAVLGAALADCNAGASTRARLVAASIELADAGADDLELAALTRLGILGWQAADMSVADHLLPRVERLADSGDPTALAVVELGAALMGEFAGDHQSMWSHVDAFAELEVPEPLHTMGQRYLASVDLLYASSADALARLTMLEVSSPTSMRDELQVLALWAARLAGDHRSARRWSEPLRLRAHDPERGLVARTTIGLHDAWDPDVVHTDPARDVDAAMAVADAARASGMLVPSLVAALEAALHSVAAGDEVAASQRLAGAFGSPGGIGVRALPAAVRALAVVWVLLPDWRDQLSVLDTGDGPAAALRAARCLCAARDKPEDTGWRDDAATVLGDPALAMQLPAVWVAELAARLVGRRPDDTVATLAQDAVARLGPRSAHWLRRVAAVSPERRVAEGAKALLARRTPVSEGHFILRLLGPVQIERDGVLLDEPDWRRDRVRALFSLIALHGTMTRRAAAEALWPDLDPDASANNLRVTLSYLQRVLEPDRTRHEGAYHLRGDGTTLRFAGRPSWTIDVEEFESALDAAEHDDRRGESAVALTGYLAAVDWYRGPFLADTDLDAAAEIERERLASRYVRALTRAGGLLLGDGRVEEAQRFAVAAQSADPWSELAVCLQAEAYLAAGDRASARRTLDRAAALLDELGLGPSPELARIERSLAA